MTDRQVLIPRVAVWRGRESLNLRLGRRLFMLRTPRLRVDRIHPGWKLYRDAGDEDGVRLHLDAEGKP